MTQSQTEKSTKPSIQTAAACSNEERWSSFYIRWIVEPSLFLLHQVIITVVFRFWLKGVGFVASQIWDARIIWVKVGHGVGFFHWKSSNRPAFVLGLQCSYNCETLYSDVKKALECNKAVRILLSLTVIEAFWCLFGLEKVKKKIKFWSEWQQIFNTCTASQLSYCTLWC